MFWGSSHCSTFPPSHRRISTIRPHKTSHTGNLHQGFDKYNVGVHNYSLQQKNLYKRGKSQQQSPLYLERDKALSQTTIISSLRGTRHKAKPITITSTLRGITTNLIAQPPLHLEGKAQSQSKGKVTTLGGLNKPQTNFLHKTKIL